MGKPVGVQISPWAHCNLKFKNMTYKTTKKFMAKPLMEEIVRFAALGGLEEIGRNMMFFEYGNEIVIIDAGLQFPEDTTPGIDFIIPNVAYLEKRKKISKR